MPKLKGLLKISICAILMSSITSCGSKAHQNHSFHQYLSAHVHNATNSIDLGGFDEFKWDRLYVIPPYTIQQNLDSTLNKHADRVLETDIEYADNQCLLVFFNKDELVSLIPVKRDLDFNAAAKYNQQKKLTFYTKKQSLFKVIKGACKNCFVLKPEEKFVL